MQITKTSGFTGVKRTMELDCTDEQIAAWRGGVLLQNAFPNLNAAEREFLATGVTQEEWDAALGTEAGE